MPGFSLGHLANHVLLRDLTALVRQDRKTTATLIAHLAEVDRRRLYADAGYGSMFDYCVRVLGFSEDVAGKRITAARVARTFPRVFAALEEGRLHIAGLCVISRQLRTLPPNEALELLAAAEHKTRDQIQELLAERFPQPDLAPSLTPAPQLAASETFDLTSHAPGRVEVRETSGEGGPASVSASAEFLLETGMPSQDTMPADAVRPPSRTPSVAPPSPAPARVAPLSPGRYALKLTMSAETREKLERAKSLLRHTVEPGDLAGVLDRALDALIEKLERRRFATTDQPRASRGTHSARGIPADVRRKVYERDGGRCTFSSDDGKRCDKTDDVEYDHIIPVAKGGRSTVDNLRLRCPAHNQLEAERAFGAGFMQEKRDQTRDVRERNAAPRRGFGDGALN